MRRGIYVWALAAAVGVRAGGQDAPAERPSVASMTDADKERFLLEAQVVRTKLAPGGITASLRATLRKDGFEHDAHIQTIDEAKPYSNLASGVELDFRDSYKNNVAAYRLDRLLDLGMIPVTVVRYHDRKKAAYTWWVDDVKMSEKDRLAKKTSTPDAEAWNRQMLVVRVFDQLIFNVDRNLGNLLIDSEWRIWMIDHTRAFKVFKELNSPKNLGPKCARGLLAGLKRLDEPTLAPAMKDLLTPQQVEALLKRRDLIVSHYEKLIADIGEAVVLYDLPTRVSGAPEPR
jgi:hypothetical protein